MHFIFDTADIVSLYTRQPSPISFSHRPHRSISATAALQTVPISSRTPSPPKTSSPSKSSSTIFSSVSSPINIPSPPATSDASTSPMQSSSPPPLTPIHLSPATSPRTFVPLSKSPVKGKFLDPRIFEAKSGPDSSGSSSTDNDTDTETDVDVDTDSDLVLVPTRTHGVTQGIARSGLMNGTKFELNVSNAANNGNRKNRKSEPPTPTGKQEFYGIPQFHSLNGLDYFIQTITSPNNRQPYQAPVPAVPPCPPQNPNRPQQRTKLSKSAKKQLKAQQLLLQLQQLNANIGNGTANVNIGNGVVHNLASTPVTNNSPKPKGGKARNCKNSNTNTPATATNDNKTCISSDNTTPTTTSTPEAAPTAKTNTPTKRRNSNAGRRNSNPAAPRRNSTPLPPTPSLLNPTAAPPPVSPTPTIIETAEPPSAPVASAQGNPENAPAGNNKPKNHAYAANNGRKQQRWAPKVNAKIGILFCDFRKKKGKGGSF